MKYEITHDNIAYQVFRKASETQRRRARVKKLVEERYIFYFDSLAKDPEGVPPVLSKEELVQIQEYFEEIHFEEHELDYIKASKDALSAAETKENKRLEKERALQRRITIYSSSVAIVSIIAACVFAYYYNKTEAQRRIAEASYLQGQSIKAYNSGNVTDAYRYAAEAVELCPDSSSNWQALYKAVFQPNESPYFLYFRNIADNINTESILNTVLSENDSLMAIQYNTGIIELYNLQTPFGKSVINDTLKLMPKGLHFDQKSNRILTYDDNSIHIYNIDGEPYLESHIRTSRTIYDADFNPQQQDSIDILGNLYMASWNFTQKTKLRYYFQKEVLADNDIKKMVWDDMHRFALLETTKDGFQLFKRNAGQTEPYTNYGNKFLDATFVKNPLSKTTQVVLQGTNYLEWDFVESNTPHITSKIPWTQFTKKANPNRRITLGDEYFSVENGDSTTLFSLREPQSSPINVESQPMYVYDYPFKAVGFGNFAADAPQFYLYDISNTDKSQVGYTEANGSGHRREIRAAHFTKSHKLITLGADGVIKKWSLNMPAVATLETKYNIRAAQFDYTGDYVLTQSLCDSNYLWHKGLLTKWRSTGKQVCFTPNNTGILSLYKNGFQVTKLNEVNKNSPVFTPLGNSPTKWLGVASNQKNLLITNEKGVLYILDDDGKVINEFNKSGFIDSAKVSPDGKYMIIFSPSRTWLTNSDGKLINTTSFSVPLLTVKFSADSRYVLFVTKPTGTTGENRKVVYNTGTGNPIWQMDGAQSSDLLNNPHSYSFDHYSNYLVIINRYNYYTYSLLSANKKPVDKSDFAAFAPLNRYRLNLYDRTGLESHPVNYKHPILNGRTTDIIESSLTYISFSNTGNYFVLNGLKKTLASLRLFDKQANVLAEIDPSTVHSVGDCTSSEQDAWHSLISRNDRYLLTYSDNGIAKLWYLSPESIKMAMHNAGIID